MYIVCGLCCVEEIKFTFYFKDLFGLCYNCGFDEFLLRAPLTARCASRLYISRSPTLRRHSIYHWLHGLPHRIQGHHVRLHVPVMLRSAFLKSRFLNSYLICTSFCKAHILKYHHRAPQSHNNNTSPTYLQHLTPSIHHASKPTPQRSPSPPPSPKPNIPTNPPQPSSPQPSPEPNASSTPTPNTSTTLSKPKRTLAVSAQPRTLHMQAKCVSRLRTRSTSRIGRSSWSRFERMHRASLGLVLNCRIERG